MIINLIFNDFCNIVVKFLDVSLQSQPAIPYFIRHLCEFLAYLYGSATFLINIQQSNILIPKYHT